MVLSTPEMPFFLPALLAPQQSTNQGVPSGFLWNALAAPLAFLRNAIVGGSRSGRGHSDGGGAAAAGAELPSGSPRCASPEHDLAAARVAPAACSSESSSHEEGGRAGHWHSEGPAARPVSASVRRAAADEHGAAPAEVAAVAAPPLVPPPPGAAFGWPFDVLDFSALSDGEARATLE